MVGSVGGWLYGIAGAIRNEFEEYGQDEASQDDAVIFQRERV